MSRPWVLVFLLLLIVYTSQFEWKQIGLEMETSSSLSRKQHYASTNEESVKERIILSQEKNIQKLNELVQSLREHLRLCRSENQVVNVTAFPLTDLEKLPILGD